MQLPGAIFMVNSDLTDFIKNTLINQLLIHETMLGAEFDTRVSQDPNYPNIVRNTNTRILVIRNDFRDYTNRDLMDVVIFVSSGLATIEKSNYGPPELSLPIYTLNIYDLLRYNKKIK